MGVNLDAAAHSAATSNLNLLRAPTEGQARAGNYRKGHAVVAGMRVAIENPAGSRRRPEWPALTAHYGYVKGSMGADGDQVDVFLRPSTAEDWGGTVYVIDQINADGTFDEHKCMVGYDDQQQAVRAYSANYTRDWKVGPVTPMPVAQFRSWLRSGTTTQPLAMGKIALALLVKGFNADQPRDDGGRWTAGGGGGGSLAPTEAGMGMRTPASISSPSDSPVAELNSEHLQRLGPQAANDLVAIYRAAAAEKPAFDNKIRAIAAMVNGTPQIPRLKGSDRATEKIVSDYNGDAKQIKDVLRATIEVNSAAEAQQALAQLRTQFDVLPTGFRNTLTNDANPADGYRDIKMNIRSGGVVAEIQVNVPAMLAAKGDNHKLYEERRSLEGRLQSEGRGPTPAEASRIAGLNSDMKAAYDRAWKKASGG